MIICQRSVCKFDDFLHDDHQLKITLRCVTYISAPWRVRLIVHHITHREPKIYISANRNSVVSSNLSDYKKTIQKSYVQYIIGGGSGVQSVYNIRRKKNSLLTTHGARRRSSSSCVADTLRRSSAACMFLRGARNHNVSCIYYTSM